MGLSINGLKKGCWEDMDQMKGIKNSLTLVWEVRDENILMWNFSGGKNYLFCVAQP